MPLTELTDHWTALAARQHGLVSRDQLRLLGMTDRQIQHLLGSGRLRLQEPTVYMVTGAPLTWHARLLAVCLTAGAVASHRSAAVLHGIDGFRPGPTEVTVPRPRNARAVAGRVHWTTDLDRTSPITIDGIPATPMDRTLLDLGAVCRDATVERAIDFAIARRRITWPELLDVYRAHSRSGRRGCGPLRRILEARFDDAHTIESPIERDLVHVLDNAGLAGFETQLEVFDDAGFILRADVGWRRPMVLLEADSLAFHLNAVSFQRDKTNRNRARVAGWQLLEYTAIDIGHRPDRIVREVLQALESRGWHR